MSADVEAEGPLSPPESMIPSSPSPRNGVCDMKRGCISCQAYKKTSIKLNDLRSFCITPLKNPRTRGFMWQMPLGNACSPFVRRSAADATCGRQHVAEFSTAGFGHVTAASID
jgi:hypothetical protein